MFSGLVEITSTLFAVERRDLIHRLTIARPALFNDLKIGDSVAVNGVCLTVVMLDENIFSFDAVPETLRCTNLGYLEAGSAVNLERSIRGDQRIGGHFLQGHVDTTCEILSITAEGDAWLVEFSLPAQFAVYLVDKGYVALDGMSITLIDVGADRFSVTFIPHTREVTIVQLYRVGQLVNLEVDMLGKYVIKFLENQHEKS